MDKSCSTCPSFVPQDRVEAEFRGNLGGGFCNRFGYVLGKPGLSDSSVATLHHEFAEKCDSHGAPALPTPDRKTFPTAVVSSADTSLVLKASEPGFSPDTIGSCRSCANMVESDTIRDEFGWPLPLCAAQGRLLLPHRMVKEPKRCGLAKAGPNRTDTENLYLDTRYQEAFNFGTVGVEISSSDAEINAGDDFVDPKDYETDKPVSEKMSALGIRAWRKITSPWDSTKFTFMPIFRADAFPENVRHLIPQAGDKSHPELYVDHQHLEYRMALVWAELGKCPSMTGHAGVGKTELMNYLAWRCQMPTVVMSITEKSDIEDLKGKWLFREGETRFSMGRLSEWWVSPSFLLVDEPRTGPEEIWEMMRPMTDSRQYIPLDEKEGEVLHKHPFCFFALADNFSWDSRYVGVHEISEADRDRLYHVLVGLPPEPLERKILLRRLKSVHDQTLPTATMDKLMTVARELRAMGDGKHLSITWGMRPQIKVMELLPWVPVEEAYRMAMLNDLEPQTIDQVLGVVRDHFV